MGRFDGYNRHDFHHPRTSREAFGSGFRIEKEPSKLKEVLLWVAYVACVIGLMLLIQGWK
jgi:hypothetical protein